MAEISAVCRDERVWLHVDAAYAGVAAIIPEYRNLFDGWNTADSIVVNPHKWLFTPFDLSAFYCRRMDTVRQAFTLTPDYLRTSESARGVRNLMDTGIQLGRRFRALKLWMVLRDFGIEGVQAAIEEHIRLAKLFARWVDADPDFERVAPVPFSVVCFRVRPRLFAGSLDELDALNARVLDAVNATGEVFLSHTRLNQHFVLRLAIGHFRTTERHIRRAFELLKQYTAQLAFS